MRLILKLSVWLCMGLVCFHDCLSLVDAGKAAFAFESNSDEVSWSHLSYRAESLLGKVTTDVRLMAVSAKEAAGLLIKDPAGEALQPSEATFYTLTVSTHVNPLFGSAEILETRSWFNPKGTGALQRIRLRQGKEKWQKSYRFTPKGVLRLRQEPQDSRQQDLSVDQWTRTKVSFYPFDAAGMGCTDVLEPSGLLVIASALELEQPAPPHYLCVFNKKQLHRVEVAIGGTRKLQVNYLEKSLNNRIRRSKRVDAVKLSFRPRPVGLEKNEAPEVFSFLGLKGDFDIYIDAESGFPVQVSGKISMLGKLDIRLVEVELTK